MKSCCHCQGNDGQQDCAKAVKYHQKKHKYQYIQNKGYKYEHLLLEDENKYFGLFVDSHEFTPYTKNLLSCFDLWNVSDDKSKKLKLRQNQPLVPLEFDEGDGSKKKYWFADYCIGECVEIKDVKDVKFNSATGTWEHVNRLWNSGISIWSMLKATLNSEDDDTPRENPAPEDDGTPEENPFKPSDELDMSIKVFIAMDTYETYTPFLFPNTIDTAGYNPMNRKRGLLNFGTHRTKGTVKDENQEKKIDHWTPFFVIRKFDRDLRWGNECPGGFSEGVKIWCKVESSTQAKTIDSGKFSATSIFKDYVDNKLWYQHKTKRSFDATWNSLAHLAVDGIITIGPLVLAAPEAVAAATTVEFATYLAKFAAENKIAVTVGSELSKSVLQNFGVKPLETFIKKIAGASTQFCGWDSDDIDEDCTENLMYIGSDNKEDIEIHPARGGDYLNGYLNDCVSARAGRDLTDAVTVASDKGVARAVQGLNLGIFRRNGQTHNSQPVYQNSVKRKLFFNNIGAWMIGDDPEKNAGGIKTANTEDASITDKSWQFYDGSEWRDDSELTAILGEPNWPDQVRISSSGEAAEKLPDYMGEYGRVTSGDLEWLHRPIFKKTDGNLYLHYDRNGYWIVGADKNSTAGQLISKDNRLVMIPATFKFWGGSAGWTDDSSLGVVPSPTVVPANATEEKICKSGTAQSPPTTTTTTTTTTSSATTSSIATKTSTTATTTSTTATSTTITTTTTRKETTTTEKPFLPPFLTNLFKFPKWGKK